MTCCVLLISIKTQLLYEFLMTTRKDYIKRLTQYHEQRLCASFTRYALLALAGARTVALPDTRSLDSHVCACASAHSEVRLDDARAIVQNSLSWGSLINDRQAGGATSASSGTGVRLQPPIFELFANALRKMEELVKRGVQLTLERDHEQRYVVERQRQQRQSIDAANPLHAGLPSSKKRDGSVLTTGAGASSPGSSSGSSSSPNDPPPVLRKRQSSRRLLFMMQFKDTMPLAQPLTVVEDTVDTDGAS